MGISQATASAGLLLNHTSLKFKSSWFMVLGFECICVTSSRLITAPPPPTEIFFYNTESFPQKAQGHLWPTSRAHLPWMRPPRPTDVLDSRGTLLGNPLPLSNIYGSPTQWLKGLGKKEDESDMVAVLKISRNLNISRHLLDTIKSLSVSVVLSIYSRSWVNDWLKELEKTEKRYPYISYVIHV